MDNLKLKNAHEAFEMYLSFNNTTDRRLIGVFEKIGNGQYKVKDLRMSDFSRIDQYKVIDSNGFETEPKGAMDITFSSTPINSIKSNSYYYFHWKYTNNNPDNLCEITIDLEKGIELLTPYDIVTLLYNAQMALAHGNAKTNNQTLDTLTKQLTASAEEVFIYELLQNANDYPYEKGKEVDVEIRLTENYLIFRHTGAEFSPKNVAALCNANDKDKTDNPDAIGYKGIGFKTVFNHNNYIYLLTGGFSFSYDSEIKKKKANIPWKVTPIWKEKDELDTEISSIFWESRDNYHVQFAMRPIKHDKLRIGNDSYLSILKTLFKDETKILFIPHLGTVRVFLNNNDSPDYVCSRNSINWCLSEVFENDVDPSITEKINEELKDDEENETSRIPSKYKNFKKTGVSFACKVEGRKLIPQDKAIMYCYLPAETANWGFKFFMNSDMIPDGPRADIEKGIELNFYLAENAGKMFYRWLHSLIISEKYDYETIFALVPNFADCKQKRPVNVGLVQRFQDGFESCLKLPLIPTANGEIVPIENIIWDDTYISSSGIITDEQFYEFSGCVGYLPHPSLRNNEDFKKFINRYLAKYSQNNVFKFSDFKECISKNERFKEWLLNPKKNGEFIDFLMSSKDDQIKEFCKLPIFIDNNGNLRTANEIYYTGDNLKSALELLDPFIEFFPHLSFHTLDFFKEEKESNWSKIWPTLGFKQFKAGEFISKVLFSSDNREKVLFILNDLHTSVKFYKFLAKNSKDNFGDFEFASLPFIDSENNVINSFKDKLVFYDERKEKNILKEKWFNPSWAYFINELYTEDDDDCVWKFFNNYKLVKFFDNKTIINDVLSNESNYPYIIEKTTGNLPASISFVHYIFNNKHHLTENTDYKRIPLNVVDLEGKMSFQICSDIIVFPTIEKKYTMHSWIEPTWMYKLDTAYFTGFSEREKESFFEFLRNKFKVNNLLSDKSFYGLVAKNNRMLIASKMAIDTTINEEFYSYLANCIEHDYFKQENLEQIFGGLPYIDNKGKIIKKKSSESFTYLFNSDLANIAEEIWIPEGLISIISPNYSHSRSKDLFRRLGFKEYSDSEFGSFFANILKDRISLNTYEEVSHFHYFMCNRLHMLNEQQKGMLKNMPVFLYSPQGAKKHPQSNGHYIQTPRLDITKEIENGFLPLFDAIDKRLSETDEMQKYWADLGNTSFTVYECNKWLKKNKVYFDSKISDACNNILFWRWLKSINMPSPAYNLTELSSFPLLKFSEREENSNNEKETTMGIVSSSIYMSNIYHKGIETFANRYGKKDFVSELYIEDPNNSEECSDWYNFFKRVGIKDDIKDVIRQVINDDLDKLEDENIPSVIIEQFHKELENDWETLKGKLVNLKVKLQNSEKFLPISETVIIDTQDYTTEPLEFIALPNEISSLYSKQTPVFNLIKKISEVAGTKIIRYKNEWIKSKIKAYIELQNTYQADDTFFEIHRKFIESFADIYKRNYPNWELDAEACQIMLFDKNGVLQKPNTLSLGHVYKPLCDFEGNGITNIPFIHDYYSEVSNRSVLLDLFNEVFKVKMKFHSSDLIHLENPQFCVYFWNIFLLSDEEPNKDFLRWVKEGFLTDKLCIANRAGEVCKVDSLYSINIKDYVENKITNWEQKLPNVPKNSFKIRDILTEMKFKSSLDFPDCLDYLLNTSPESTFRSVVLGWIASNYNETKRYLVERYRNSENAKWLNGQKKAVHISSLYAISNDNNGLISSFRNNEHIIDLDRFKTSVSQENLYKALNILGIPVLSDEDLTASYEVESNETDEIRQIIKLRLLALIGSRKGVDWQSEYMNVKSKLDLCKFLFCSKIAYQYKELVADKEVFFAKQNTYYYIKDWQSKQVFTHLIGELIQFLQLPYNNTEITRFLDLDDYTNDDIKEFIEHECKDLMYNNVFLSEIRKLSTEFVNASIEVVPDTTNTECDYEQDEEPKILESVQNDEVYNPYAHRSSKTQVIGDTEREENTIVENVGAKMHNEQRQHNQDSSNVTTSGSAIKENSAVPELHSEQRENKISRNDEEGINNQHVSNQRKDDYVVPDEFIETQLDDEMPMDSAFESPTYHRNTGVSKRRIDTGSERSTNQFNKNQHNTYNPIDEIAEAKEKESFDTNDSDANEYELAHIDELFEKGLTQAEIADQNTLVKTRMFNSFAEHGHELEMDEVDFIRNVGNNREYDVKTKSGKYIHIVSAYNGVMYLSPTFWNRVQREDCIVCVVLSHRARNFKYIHNTQDLEKIIGNDELVVKISGTNKINLVNQLYGKTLHNAQHKVYTMIRVKTGTRFDMLFKSVRSEWDESEMNNNDEL